MSSKISIDLVDFDLAEEYLMKLMKLLNKYKAEKHESREQCKDIESDKEIENSEKFDQIPISKPRSSILVGLDYEEEIENNEGNDVYEETNIGITEDKEIFKISDKNTNESNSDKKIKKLNPEDKSKLMDHGPDPDDEIFDESADGYETVDESTDDKSKIDNINDEESLLEEIIKDQSPGIQKRQRFESNSSENTEQLNQPEETFNKSEKNLKNFVEFQKCSNELLNNPEETSIDSQNPKVPVLIIKLPPGRLKCNDCGIILARSSYNAHIAKHKKEDLGRILKCNFCSYTSISRRNLDSHLKLIHKNEAKNPTLNYSKMNLNKSLMNSSILRKKINRTLNSSLHQSKLMNSSIKRTKKTKKTIAKLHFENLRKAKNGEKRIKCEECQKVFTFKSYVKHMLRHKYKTAKHGFKCPKCNMTFISVSGVKSHASRIHDEHEIELIKVELNPEMTRKVQQTKSSTQRLKKVKCDECERIVSCRFYKDHKYHHEMIKSGTKLKCAICGSKSSWKQGMNRHFREKHNGIKISYEICKEE